MDESAADPYATYADFFPAGVRDAFGRATGRGCRWHAAAYLRTVRLMACGGCIRGTRLREADYLIGLFVNDAPLFLITGIMAAGKSTVAQALAERFERSAHVRGDTFRKWVVAGRCEMSAEPSPEALEQLRLRYQLAASVADQYRRAGFVTVMQDIILGPMLGEVCEMFETPPSHVVVLVPEASTVEQRELQRPKTGYVDFTPGELDQALRRDTPGIGLWLDSTDLTLSETVDAILAYGV